MRRSPAPAAVTGMGCLCAAGAGVDACMERILRGERSPRPPRGFCLTLADPPPVFEVPEGFFDPRPFRHPPRLRTGQMTFTALVEALRDANLDRDILKKIRVGVVIGTNAAGTHGNQEIGGGPDNPVSPYVLPEARYAATNPAFQIAREFELTGPLQTIVNACSSGADAIGAGAAWIRAGICDLVIAGGADPLSKITYIGFISLMNMDPRPVRPFDADRNGLNLGEGAGVAILESCESASARSRKPRAFVRGYGSASDAYHLTAPSPDGIGLRKAMAEALAESGLNLSDIAFINAHGTGTVDNDLVEAKVFHTEYPGVPFFSTKGHTGHTLGAAGALEAVFTVACLEKGRIPASAGFTTPDPDMPVHPVTAETPVSGKSALSTSLAFGGNNAALVLSLEEA